MYVVEGYFMVIIDVTVHQFYHTVNGFVATGEYMLFYHTLIIERINLVGFLNP